MNIYGTIGSVFAYSSLTILNYSDGHTARQVAIILFILAILCAVMMVVSTLRQSFGLQVREDSTVPSIDDNSPRAVESTSSPIPRTPIEPEAAQSPIEPEAAPSPIEPEAAPSHIEPEAAPSPTPSYGPSEKSPISTDEVSKPLAGMSFALTGTMPVKRTKMECLIEHFGGTVHKRIRKDTNYLVTGDSRELSAKEAKADKWNTPTLTVEELAEMCGITSYDIRDRYSQIVPSEVVSIRIMSDEQRREVREYSKAASGQRTLLKELMQIRQDIALPHPIQVILQSGDDMELTTIDRLKFNTSVGDYLMFSTDGEALYIDDLRDCSVNDIIRVMAA